MPKYPRRRLNDGPNGPSSFPGMPPGMPMMPPVYGFPPLPLNFMQPPPALPMSFPPPPPAAAVAGNGAKIAPMGAPFLAPGDGPTNFLQGSSSKEPEKRDLPKYHREGLVHFDDERELVKARSAPTDLVIIDLDTALLQIPGLNEELFSVDARKAIGKRLERFWPYNRVMLEAMIEMGRWDPALVEIAREASRTEQVLLVLTTRWKQSDIALITTALKNEGIERIDHFACPCVVSEGENPSIDEGVDAEAETEADADADAEDGSREDERLVMFSKNIMLELLLDSYESLERVSIFEATPSHCKRYRKSMGEYVRHGVLAEEAFYIPEISPRRLPSIPITVEKELVDKILEQTKISVERSTVVIEWVYKLTEESQQSLATKLISALGEQFVLRLHLDDIAIVQGKLPPDMRALIPPSGTAVPMTVTGYKIKKHSLWFKLGNASSLMLKAATFHRDVKISDQDVNLVPPQPQSVIAIEDPASDAALRPDLTTLQQFGGVRIDTFVYERRQLRANIRRPRR